MNNSTEIKRVLKNIANDNGKGDNRNLFFTAEVKKVDSETCDVEVGGFTITGVHLASVSNGNKNNLIIKPKVGSVVLVCDKTGGDMAWLNVVSFSEIESVTLKVDEILINEGKNGGLCITPELKTQLDKMTARIDGIINALNAGTAGTGAPDSGAALITSIKTVLATIVDKENFLQIENPKIKH